MNASKASMMLLCRLMGARALRQKQMEILTADTVAMYRNSEAKRDCLGVNFGYRDGRGTTSAPSNLLEIGYIAG